MKAYLKVQRVIHAAEMRVDGPPQHRRSLSGLQLLLSPLYVGALASDHRADLKASGLEPETVRMHKLTSVPPSMLRPLLGFDLKTIVSAMLIPYPAPTGGWMAHVRVKCFPTLMNADGSTIKYLQPRAAPPRLFFPLPTLQQALDGAAPLWVIEGEKKALAVAQLGLPVIGFAGIEGWHQKGSRSLLPDFDIVPLQETRRGGRS